MAHEVKFTLPPSLVGPIDLSRLLRELDTINEHLMQLKLRHSGAEIKLPKTTGLLDQLVMHNKLNLLHEKERLALINFLVAVKDQSPVIHMSFSSDPSEAFLEKLMNWLRQEIHPYLLLTVGLQPNVGAGCILRTTNKYFDLSLKQSFQTKRDILVKKLVDGVSLEPLKTEVQ